MEDISAEKIIKKTYEVSLGGVRHRVVRWIDERIACARPIVLLHGFAQSVDTWDKVATCLAAKEWSVYALDFVGHGESERPGDPAPYALDVLCDTLLAFLRRIQCESGGCAPVVVGYSMGGRVALTTACCALRESQQAPAVSCQTTAMTLPFSALVLESAGLGPETEEERTALEQRNRTWATDIRHKGVTAFMDTWERLPLFATQRSLPTEVQKQVRTARLANDAEVLARTLEGSGAHVMPARSEVLAALTFLMEAAVPVLYVAGERDTKYQALAQSFAAAHTSSLPQTSQMPCDVHPSRISNISQTPRIPQSSQAVQIQCVEGVGHNVHLEAPEQFVAIVESFLAW